MQASNGARKFEAKQAVRGPSPLLFGLIGPSGSGKTYSALRLATGIQRIFAGDIMGIDTESNRMLHYADKFRFKHISFAAPFSPLDYLAAIEYSLKQGAKTIIVDSMSHEHEGPGGVLEMHQRELERLSGGDSAKAERVKMLAWAKPKAERRRFINTLLQMNANFIFCFRAKEKIKIVRGKEPEELGFMPIAGEEFVYELTAKALLMPGANGIPTWTSRNTGEQMMMKIPEQFRGIFLGTDPKQLDEDIGEEMARWAAGGTGNAFADEYLGCRTQEAFDALEKRRMDLWKVASAADKKIIKSSSEAAAARIKAAAEAPPSDEPTAPSEGAGTETDLGEVTDGDLDEFRRGMDQGAAQ
jgi:hypothetical protein